MVRRRLSPRWQRRPRHLAVPPTNGPVTVVAENGGGCAIRTLFRAMDQDTANANAGRVTASSIPEKFPQVATEGSLT
jgi:hypothetical protein